MRLLATTLILVFAIIVTLGLAISLQEVFGINIGSVLNLQGQKIINVGAPTVAGDAATWDFVNSVAGTLQTRVTGACGAGQVIYTVNPDGSVLCQ